jgi:phosphohistidine phosphatase SixA
MTASSEAHAREQERQERIRDAAEAMYKALRDAALALDIAQATAVRAAETLETVSAALRLAEGQSLQAEEPKGQT